MHPVLGPLQKLIVPKHAHVVQAKGQAWLGLLSYAARTTPYMRYLFVGNRRDGIQPAITHAHCTDVIINLALCCTMICTMNANCNGRLWRAVA